MGFDLDLKNVLLVQVSKRHSFIHILKNKECCNGNY